jgi:hypothetical protein
VRIRQALARFIFVLISGLVASGCAQLDLDSRVTRRSHIYVGAVRVNIPVTYGELRAIDVSTLGVGADESLFVGWRRGQFVYVQPDECQLLLIIRSPVEAEHAISILRAVEGDQLCVADFAGTLPTH